MTESSVGLRRIECVVTRHVQAISNMARRGLRRRDGSRYATLRAMHRAAASPTPRFRTGLSSAWLARRWYYTPRSHRAYSVRQISPGDRRLLAEFALSLNETAAERAQPGMQSLNEILFDRVISNDGVGSAVGFVALQNTAAGDRVIGAAAYAPSNDDGTNFIVAVANSFREEQVGRTLLSTLLRHAKRVGVPRFTGEMLWSNRPMHMLAMSMGFVVEQLPGDRNVRRLQLSLK
jgi:GNAT superfamily N-acetyltransferase